MALTNGTTKKISKWRPKMFDPTKMWVRPSVGLWFGAAAGNNDGDDSGEGGAVIGSFEVMIGVLAGTVAGIGERWGLYTGLMGAIAVIPLLGLGFIGVPIGIHYKKKFGIGLIIPVVDVNPFVALVVGAVLFTATLWLTGDR